MEIREPNVFDHWGPRDTVLAHSSKRQCVSPDHLTDTPEGYHFILTLLTNRRKLTW